MGLTVLRREEQTVRVALEDPTSPKVSATCAGGSRDCSPAAPTRWSSTCPVSGQRLSPSAERPASPTRWKPPSCPPYAGWLSPGRSPGGPLAYSAWAHSAWAHSAWAATSSSVALRTTIRVQAPT